MELWLTPRRLVGNRAVAACRTVIQLQDPNESDAYTHQAAVIGGMNPLSSRHGQHQSVFTPEVRVKTEQIVMDDFGCVSFVVSFIAR